MSNHSYDLLQNELYGYMRRREEVEKELKETQEIIAKLNHVIQNITQSMIAIKRGENNV